MIIDSAKSYWTIIRQFNRHRDDPTIADAALRNLQRIGEHGSPAVSRRIAHFTVLKGPGGGGNRAG